MYETRVALLLLLMWRYDGFWVQKLNGNLKWGIIYYLWLSPRVLSQFLFHIKLSLGYTCIRWDAGKTGMSMLGPCVARNSSARLGLAHLTWSTTRLLWSSDLRRQPFRYPMKIESNINTKYSLIKHLYRIYIFG
jgi:hypothetical protein